MVPGLAVTLPSSSQRQLQLVDTISLVGANGAPRWGLSPRTVAEVFEAILELLRRGTSLLLLEQNVATSSRMRARLLGAKHVGGANWSGAPPERVS